MFYRYDPTASSGCGRTFDRWPRNDAGLGGYLDAPRRPNARIASGEEPSRIRRPAELLRKRQGVAAALPMRLINLDQWLRMTPSGPESTPEEAPPRYRNAEQEIVPDRGHGNAATGQTVPR